MMLALDLQAPYARMDTSDSSPLKVPVLELMPVRMPALHMFSIHVMVLVHVREQEMMGDMLEVLQTPAMANMPAR